MYPFSHSVMHLHFRLSNELYKQSAFFQQSRQDLSQDLPEKPAKRSLGLHLLAGNVDMKYSYTVQYFILDLPV